MHSTKSIGILVVLVALAVLTAPLGGDAQDPPKVSRVGFLGPRSRADSAPSLDAFLQELRRLGWVEGQNIAIEYRFADGSVDRLSILAAELVARKVDVILATSTAPAVAAKNATTTIPIVMASSADPVELGLAASLARPGGNVTGLSYSVALEVVGKQLELLKEAVPQVRRVAVLWNPSNPGSALAIKSAKSAAGSLGVQLQLVEARGPNEFEAAFAAMTRERAGAILVMPNGMFGLHRARLQALAAKNHLPAMYGLSEYTEAGGLMSYAVDYRDSFRRSATYVDKIPKGAKPADLPIEQPTKFELVINLKTAKTLGLTIPPSLVVRADHIVE